MTGKQKGSFLLLLLLLLALLSVSGFMVCREYAGRQKEEAAFMELASLVQPELPETDPGELEPSAEETGTEPTHRRNLALVMDQNSDCIGWLCIPGTGIDYPVMHTPGEPQKYLRLDFYGAYSQSGTPFLDGRCHLTSTNLILYGHNMRSGTMFGALKNYRKEGYGKAHPVIELETQAGCAEYVVFLAAAVTKWDPWYRFIEASDPAGFEERIRSLKSRALYDTGVVPKYGQQLLTLSTCGGDGKDSRLLVIAVKEEKP